MNNTKLSNPVRLIAFFLTAVVLISTFGFTADGWQRSSKQENHPQDNQQSQQTEQMEDSPSDDSPTEDAEPYIPQYINRLTGLECDEPISKAFYYAFVTDQSLPSYGISQADLICDIPTESGIRRIAFIPSTSQFWKLGSLTQTRGYISNIAYYFGGICISYGRDDSINYGQCDINNIHFDLSEKEEYYYTEYTDRIYTNSSLISLGTGDIDIDLELTKKDTVPFCFIGFEEKLGSDYQEQATTVEITDSDSSKLHLIYNEEKGEYAINRYDSFITDCLNGNQLGFTNCFVLFADSVIYDNEQCCQMVMDTIGSGVGFYFSEGLVYEIKWKASDTGELQFTLPDGQPLFINRGRSYISYFKSSARNSVKFK